MARASFRLTEQQAADDPAGHLLVSGLVDSLEAGLVTSGAAGHEVRARDAETARAIFDRAHVACTGAALEAHEFEDPVTFTVRRVRVWVPKVG